MKKLYERRKKCFWFVNMKIKKKNYESLVTKIYFQKKIVEFAEKKHEMKKNF